ncbi:Protein NDR [Trema orientale]|uniref:Protein NDR n=1 Tax=Trema orientale TaxID=63057 RepID=A0A2P5FRC5_TREOI|nr:Protein NDR [Trema orientale]
MKFSGKPGARCGCCLALFIVPGITLVMFLWSILHPGNPTFSIEKTRFPAVLKFDHKGLNNSSSSSGQLNDTTISLQLTLYNGNRIEGIHYDNVNLNLSYVFTNPNARGHPLRREYSPIDHTTIPAFYQGHRKRAISWVDFSAKKVNWTEVRGLLYSTNNTLIFRLDLATTMRFMINEWNTKTRELIVGANVEISYSGYYQVIDVLSKTT